MLDLRGDAVILFEFSHSSSRCMYCCVWAAAIGNLGCCEVIVMSSAYVFMCVSFSGWGRSCVNRLKSVGDSIAPCGTPFFIFLVLDDILPCVTWACLSVM